MFVGSTSFSLSSIYYNPYPCVKDEAKEIAVAGKAWLPGYDYWFKSFPIFGTIGS